MIRAIYLWFMCLIGKHPERHLKWKHAVGGRKIQFCNLCETNVRELNITIDEVKQQRKV